MRILYILSTLGIGGAERQVIALAERMAACGHTVAILSLKHADEEWPAKLPVMRLNLPKTPLGLLRGLRFARNFLAAFQPDLIHSHTFPANLFTRLLALWMRSRGPAPAVINTIHNVHEGGWHRMQLYRLTDPVADRVTAVSEAARERFLQLGAVSPGKFSVLTNGIDTAEFIPVRTRRKEIRTQMDAGSRFIWLAVGRIAPAKDYPNLLEAFRQLRETVPAAELWIAGEGDTSQLEKDSCPGTRFLGLQRDIPGLLDAADGFVLSSAWEGLPLAVGEAMSMEKPIVATSVGGVPELVDQCGILVPAKDPAALAAAMLQTMRLKESLRRATGKAARERIEHLFSMSAKAAEWQQLYAECLQEKNL